MVDARRLRTLTLGQARRTALAAQGFGGASSATAGPPQITRRDLQRVIDRVAVVQIDSVNVLTRSHYVPFFSRLGPYDTGLLDRMRDVAPRALVEYRAHEAALVTPGTWPLFAQRMRGTESTSWGQLRQLRAEHPDFIDLVCQHVRAHGPMTSREVEVALAHERPPADKEWGWNWSDVKVALEFLFWSGHLSSAGRTSAFERRYAAPELVAPAAYRGAWQRREADRTPQQAVLELVRLAARASGVAAEASLADYFRLPRTEVAVALADLADEGTVEQVRVQGWAETAYLARGARVPRELHVEALVSPFDSLVWHRPRTEALFGVRYRIEIYTPAAKRVHGYYVLPFVFGDTIVARCDLKADRAAGVLRMPRLTWEPGAPGEASDALRRATEQMAGWLGLSDVELPANLREIPAGGA